MSWKGDPNAFHQVIDGEIAGLTEKASPVGGDWVVINDSEDGDSVKSAQAGNLPGGSGGGGGSDRGVRVRRSTTQAITTSTRTAISFDTETRDDGGFWVVGSPTRVTVPSGEDGWYDIKGGVRWASTNTTGIRQAEIRINGTTLIAIDSAINPSSTVQNYNDVAAGYYLAATDYVELTVFQSSGGNLNIDTAAEFTPWLSVVRSGLN